MYRLHLQHLLDQRPSATSDLLGLRTPVVLVHTQPDFLSVFQAAVFELFAESHFEDLVDSLREFLEDQELRTLSIQYAEVLYIPGPL
jgi:hypothetical protein